jgi:hypothetical protein
MRDVALHTHRVRNHWPGCMNFREAITLCQ